MNEDSSFDQSRLVALLSETDDAPAHTVEAIQRHGLLALTKGRPATVAEISRESDIELETIRSGIRSLASAGRIETDGDEIIGVGGLTLTPTVHAVKLPGAAMHTWCALDAIGIPAALGLDAQISTTCPQCGARLDASVNDGEPDGEESLQLFCPTGQCSDVREQFCSVANLFCDLDHLRAWTTDNPTVEGEALDLAATASLGRAMWSRYRD